MKAVKNAVYMSIFGTTLFTPKQKESQLDIAKNDSDTAKNADTGQEMHLEATGT